jgi:hypothetical protein
VSGHQGEHGEEQLLHGMRAVDSGKGQGRYQRTIPCASMNREEKMTDHQDIKQIPAYMDHVLHDVLHRACSGFFVTKKDLLERSCINPLPLDLLCSQKVDKEDKDRISPSPQNPGW